MHNFTFIDGVAEIKAGDITIVNQPFEPTFKGSKPWSSEAAALEWAKNTFPQYFMEETIISEEDSEQQGNENG